MAKTVQISFRIDENIRQTAQDALNDIGLTMSAAITLYLKKIAVERRIPFELTAGAENKPDGGTGKKGA